MQQVSYSPSRPAGGTTLSNCNEILMVLEYLEHDLQGIQQRIKQSPTKVFKIGDVKTYMLQLLKGLSAMHQKGILHRDLKAANLLVSKRGVLKIADFGLSRLSAKLGEAGGVLTPQVCTLWYRAPELLLAGCGSHSASYESCEIVSCSCTHDTAVAPRVTSGVAAPLQEEPHTLRL